MEYIINCIHMHFAGIYIKYIGSKSGYTAVTGVVYILEYQILLMCVVPICFRNVKRCCILY